MGKGRVRREGDIATVREGHDEGQGQEQTASSTQERRIWTKEMLIRKKILNKYHERKTHQAGRKRSSTRSVERPSVVRRCRFSQHWACWLWTVREWGRWRNGCPVRKEWWRELGAGLINASVLVIRFHSGLHGQRTTPHGGGRVGSSWSDGKVD